MIVVVTSVILAMKLEERKKHSLDSILSLLNDEERLYITRDVILGHELTLLEQFDFDLELATGYKYLPRFLQLAGIPQEEEIKDKALALMLKHLLRNPSS